MGLLTQQTAEEQPPPPPPKDDHTQGNGLNMKENFANGYAKGDHRGYADLQSLDMQRIFTDGQLFSADELANAMTQSTLEASRRERP